MNIQIQKADARDLRSELDATIQIQRTADARAELAKETADRADHLMCEAATAAERLKSGLDDAQRAATPSASSQRDLVRMHKPSRELFSPPSADGCWPTSSRVAPIPLPVRQ